MSTATPFALRLLACCVAAPFASVASADMPAPLPPTDSAAPFAVVELFTSEGCSSCPPADDVLMRLVADGRAGDTRVFPIAFHVDYWNRLGWPDRFSSTANTDRQTRYANALRLDSVYTPQMVVNGRTEFTGSNADKAKAAIAAELKVAPTTPVTIHATRAAGGAIDVAFDTKPAGKDSPTTLVVVLVERGLSTDVRNGENGGHTLRHENVARAWVEVPLTHSGHVTLSPPADVKLEQSSVIAFAQDQTTLAIGGATMADVPAK